MNPEDTLGRPPIRKSRTVDTDIDGPGFEELCRPLSATVMPRSAMFSSGGNEMTITVAIKAQRSSRRVPGGRVK